MVLQAPRREALDLPAAADPAARDTEAPWPAGRFAARVRRTWNQVTSNDIRAAGADMAALARRIEERTGQDAARVLARLEDFKRAERLGTAHPDPLLRPGAGLPSEDHAPPR